MKFLQHQSAILEKTPTHAGKNESILPQRVFSPSREKLWDYPLQQRIIHFLRLIKSIGITTSMTDYARRKLEIFNLLNFMNLVAGLLVPVSGLVQDRTLPVSVWLAAFAPAMISVLVLALNYFKKHEAAMIAYFVLSPVITSVVYINGINLGVDLFFILYGILAVFFISRISDMLFSIGLSMISYFMLSIVLKSYSYKLETANFGLYLFNQAVAILLIFYGLFLIKRENSEYEILLLHKNDDLGHINTEIEKQRAEIAEKASLLEIQKKKLEELNSLKNKLFSVISHDLKAPMYALRNLFQNVQQQNLPGSEIKNMLPEVIADLNYTTGLMENLLQWSKSQMQANIIYPQDFDIAETVDNVVHSLRLPAKTKNISIQYQFTDPVPVYADKDMINLVVRNLVSNAIKFTGINGTIRIEAKKGTGHVELYIRDNGVGISKDNLERLFKDFYSSNGTANESGTGLGLILCKEFVIKNGGTIDVKSDEGKGSTFSFMLPTTNR